MPSSLGAQQGGTVLTGDTGLVRVQPVTSSPSTGTVGIPVYPINGAGVTPTEDAADVDIGSAVGSVGIQVAAENPSGDAALLQVDSNGNLLVQEGDSTLALNATGQITVAATATLIRAAGKRAGLLLTNPSTSVTVYIGSSGVTTNNGQALLAGNSITLPVNSAVYGIVASSTQVVSFLEIL
jgi:hypothetical protein